MGFEIGWHGSLAGVLEPGHRVIATTIACPVGVPTRRSRGARTGAMRLAVTDQKLLALRQRRCIPRRTDIVGMATLTEIEGVSTLTVGTGRERALRVWVQFRDGLDFVFEVPGVEFRQGLGFVCALAAGAGSVRTRRR